MRLAAAIWAGRIGQLQKKSLEFLIKEFRFSPTKGDLQLLDHNWYVTHSGLLSLAHRRQCYGIEVHALPDLCEPGTRRWVFRATVLTSRTCRGFVGYGDADPSNVSPLVRGAEMRVAETRAVNRALRKAYGIGICSVEEIGSFGACSRPDANVRKLPPQPVNGKGAPKLRDQLCLLIRQHHLDASQVKQYAAEFCGTSDIRNASREQIQSFIAHLAQLVAKDRDALLCKLNSYGQKSEVGAA
jgi:hypothetical protein